MKTPLTRAIKTGVVLGSLAGLLALPAGAQSVLFDGSIPPTNITDIGYNDPDAGSQRLAEDFQLPASATATGARFLGGYYPTGAPSTDSFTLTIFGDTGGVPDPGSIVAEIPLTDVERTDTGVDAFGISLYSYMASFPGVPLDAATPYWFMIVNDTSGDPTNDWVWAGLQGVGTYAKSNDNGGTWTVNPGSFSFQLLGTTVVTGACCLPDGSCVVLTGPDCEAEDGTFLGEGVLCDPNPCPPSPVEESTWGAVKSRFGTGE